MGRGAGNLNTELVMINYSDANINAKIKLCEFIQQYVKQFYENNENKWGYDLDYLLSGYFKMHPNFISKMRDLNICMMDRFKLILIINNECDASMFNNNLFMDIIDEHKNQLFY